MPKKQKPSVADQFSDEEMDQVKHYGQMLGGGVTPFDEAVEDALNKREAAEGPQEASAAKMHAAQTGAPDVAGLGPSDIDQAQIKQRGTSQRQADTQAAQQAAQAQAAQAPVNAPPAPSGPAGATIPFPAQKGAVGGGGNAPQPQQAVPPPQPPPQEGPPDEGDEEDPSTQFPP